jgi:hypothetical protein
MNESALVADPPSSSASFRGAAAPSACHQFLLRHGSAKNPSRHSTVKGNHYTSRSPFDYSRVGVRISSGCSHMRLAILDENSDFNHAALDRLTLRLAKAGWLSGSIGVSTKNFLFEYSDHGMQKLSELCRLTEIWRHKENGFWRRNLASAKFECKVQLETMRLVTALPSPRMAKAERECFRELILHFCAKYGAHPPSGRRHQS